MFKRIWNRLFQVIIVLMGLWLAWDLLAHLVAEILWFIELDYLSAFWLRLRTQLGLWAFVGCLSAGFLLSNLFLANRLKYPAAIAKEVGNPTRIPPGTTQINPTLPKTPTPDSTPFNLIKGALALRLGLLLPIVLCLDVLVGIMLLHYGEVAISLWQPDFNLPSVTPPLPPPFDWTSINDVLLRLLVQIIQLIVLVIIVIALVVNSQFWLTAMAVAFSVVFALVVSGQWGRILQYFQPTAFNANDPLLGTDISFYVFKLPVWQLLNFWLGGLCLFGLVAVTLTYLVSGNSLSHGRFPGFSDHQLYHLHGLGSLAMATVAFHYWLSRYELLYSTRGVTYGASYTDVKAQLPINTGLSVFALGIAIFTLDR